MSLLEKIIFTADLTERGRDYSDVETVRTLADRSLEQAVSLYFTVYIGEIAGKRQPDLPGRMGSV